MQMRRRRLGARAGEREQNATRVLFRALDMHPPAGPVLIVDDGTGAVAAGLTHMDTRTWQRRASGTRPGTTWPPDEHFATAVVRLPTSWAELELSLHAVAARLGTGGSLWVYGANDEGIKSAPKRIASPWFEAVETVDIKHRCRAVHAVRTSVMEGVRGTLSDWVEPVQPPATCCTSWYACPSRVVCSTSHVAWG
jgi:16S rRNA G1207 methylase RsmC